MRRPSRANWNVESVLVGRAGELATVRGLLAAVGEGRAGGLFVVGEGGVGKTRLLVEARRMGAGQGVRVAHAACLPLTTSLPFDPALELLRSLGVRLESSLIGGSPRELFGVLVQRLEQASLEGPVLLCLDDLQWSDAATLDLVHYCLARLRDLPLGWLLAARSGRSLPSVVHRLERDGLAQRLELRSLSSDETLTLAQTLLGSLEVDEDVVGAVHERTGGNPFLSVELLRALSSVDGDGSGAGGGAPASIDAVVPASVDEAIGERADRLSSGARAALDWAVVLPERFTFEDLEAVGGTSAGAAPEELADAGFLVGDGDGRWRFVHSIIHDAVYRRLPAAERVRRHGVVVDALAGMPLTRAAPQLQRARRFRDAAAAYLDLAEQSLNRGRGEDAVGLYERSAALAVEAGDELLRRGAGAGRVLALMQEGVSEEAWHAADVVRAELREVGEPGERLRFLSRFAMAIMVVHDAADLDRAREAFQEAEPLIEVAEGSLLVEALTVRAWLSLRSGESVRALADAERAAQVERSGDDALLEVRLLNSLGLALGMTRSATGGVEVLDRSLQRATAAGLDAEAARACTLLSFLTEHAGGSNEVMEAYDRRGLEFDGLAPSIEAILQSNLGVTRSLIGDLDGALAHHLAASHVAMRGGPLTRARVACGLAYVYIWRGELVSARRLLETNRVSPDGGLDARAPELWGLLLEAEGNPGGALVHFQTGASLEDPNAMWCENAVARTAVASGRVEIARASLARVQEMVALWPVGAWMCNEARGWVLVGENRPREAAGELKAAAEGCTRAYDATRLRLDAALLVGDRKGVIGAIEEFERMGAVRAADRARALAREMGMRPGRRQNRSGVLSGREQEVAQLVAAGHTNPEIAASLFLSPRTVERHVGHILIKLGYRSRVQIAAAAAAGRLPGANTTVVTETS